MTTKPKRRARRKKAAKPLDSTPHATEEFDSEDFIRLLRDTWDESLITYRLDGFYTPVDGWKPDRPMMEECDFPTFEEAIAYSDAWFYWAANRDEMI